MQIALHRKAKLWRIQLPMHAPVVVPLPRPGHSSQGINLIKLDTTTSVVPQFLTS